jgi:hypothetical protein
MDHAPMQVVLKTKAQSFVVAKAGIMVTWKQP